MAKVKNKLKPIDAPVYGYWSALYRSFYSKYLYIDVGKRWKGMGLMYLLLTVALFAIPFSLKINADFNRSFNEQLIEPILQIPDIIVQNGTVIFDKPMPYFIKNKEGQVVIIIDTTGTVTKFNEQYPYLTIFIDKNSFSYKLPTPQIMDLNNEPINKGVPVVQPLGSNTNEVFNGKKIIEDDNISRLKYASQVMIYPIVVAILYAILLIGLLVVGFLGQVFARIFFSFPLSFRQSIRLMMVAATPMLLVFLLFLTFNLIFPGFGFILMILLMAYFAFAIFSLRTDSRRMVAQ